MCMARGWESKSVEGQVQEFQTKDERKAKKQISRDEVEIRRQRNVLQLSRAQVERQLEKAPEGHYREQLTRALADLDTQLAKLK
jgi:hypothetical protein